MRGIEQYKIYRKNQWNKEEFIENKFIFLEIKTSLFVLF